VRRRSDFSNFFATEAIPLALTLSRLRAKKIRRSEHNLPKVKRISIFEKTARPFGGKTNRFLVCLIVGVCLTPQKTVWYPPRWFLAP